MSSAILRLSNKPRFADGVCFERCLALFETLSLDPSKIKSVGITGSNGKGSTANILSSILQGHGIRTGLFTSPHFICPNERFKVNGENIADEELELLAEEVLSSAAQVEKNLSQAFSRFELLTAMAFLHFKKEKIDIAILEAGIGGRLDPTRLAQPIVSCITSLELEHTEILGDTIEKIFKEKLLLLGRGGTCYLSLPKDKYLGEICNDVAKKNGITLRFIDSDDPNLKYMQTDGGIALEFNAEKFEVPLVGIWQGRNLILAVCLAKEILGKEKFSYNLARDSLKQISIPGRFEKVSESPEIYIDSAHTSEALREVVNHISADDINSVILFGVSKNKPVKPMLEIVSDLEVPFFVSCSDHGGAEPEEISNILKRHGKTVLRSDRDLEKVFNEAKYYAQSKKLRLYVLGGLFFAADVSRLEQGIDLRTSVYL